MLKIAATGNLTNDVELKTQEDGRPTPEDRKSVV